MAVKCCLFLNKCAILPELVAAVGCHDSGPEVISVLQIERVKYEKIVSSLYICILIDLYQ